MRSNQQKSRSRGRNNNNNNNNNNRRNSNPLSRSYESNGPEVRVRGNAATVAEKYVQLARDADMTGDSVAAENYLQHAEHYFRIISAAHAQIQTQQLAQQAAHQNLQARQGEVKSPDAGPGAAPDTQNRPIGETGNVAANPAVSEPTTGAENKPKAVTAPDAQAAPESAPPAPKRARRRPRDAAPAVAEKTTREKTNVAADTVVASDPADAPQPEVGELPSFVTAGTESDAAE